MRLSIVIPAYNEEKRIEETLKAITSYFDQKDFGYEVIVIDDGSKDRTSEKVLAFQNKNIRFLKNRRNRGKGYTVRRGMLEAEGETILFSDADLSTPIHEYEKLSFWINRGYDIAIASRGLAESRILVRQKWWREQMGKIFNWLVRKTMGFSFRDTQCGFKLFTASAAKHIFSLQKTDGFSFDVEIILLAIRSRFRIKEVPVLWKNSFQSKVNPVLDSLKMLFSLWKIKTGKPH